MDSRSSVMQDVSCKCTQFPVGCPLLMECSRSRYLRHGVIEDATTMFWIPPALIPRGEHNKRMSSSTFALCRRNVGAINQYVMLSGLDWYMTWSGVSLENGGRSPNASKVSRMVCLSWCNTLAWMRALG